MSEKLRYTATKEDDIKRFANLTQTEINNKLYITGGALSDANLGQIKAEFNKLKDKKVLYYLSFDGTWFSYHIKVGDKKFSLIGGVNLLEDNSITTDNKLSAFSYLMSLGLANQAGLNAFKNKLALPGIKKQIDDLKKKIKDAEDKIKPDREQLQKLEKEYKEKGGK